MRTDVVLDVGSEKEEEDDDEIEVNEEETNKERSGILGKRMFSEVEDNVVTNETLKRSRQ